MTEEQFKNIKVGNEVKYIGKNGGSFTKGENYKVNGVGTNYEEIPEINVYDDTNYNHTITIEFIDHIELVINHHNTKEITCPYCGQSMSDSIDLLDRQDDTYDIHCEYCDKEYTAHCDITVTYTTYPIKPKEETQ